MMNLPRAPRLLRAIVSATLPDDDGETLLQDLDALYRARLESAGQLSATAWYARQTFGFLAHVGISRLAEAVNGSDSIRSDASHALRSFRRRPAFAAAFILTLAVGTAVLATVYTAARWVLLRPVPGVGAPEELITLRLGSNVAPPWVSFDLSHADLMVLRDRLPVSGALAAVSVVEVDLRSDAGMPQRVTGEMVTANYFQILRAPLSAGRAFRLEDDDPLGGAPSVILSASLARSLNADAPTALVGRDLRVNGKLVRVIGIAGPGFHGSELPGRADLWFPLRALTTIDPSVETRFVTERSYPVWRRLIARPAPGTAPATIESAANVVMEAVRKEFRSSSYGATHFTFQAFPGIGLDPGVRASVKRTLTLLSGAAALLLCLAIANLMNLALVQATLRSTTTAIRFALGASERRIVRALVVEMAMLGAAGAAVALIFATSWSRWFEDMRLDERGAALAGMQIDWQVVLITFGVAVSSALVVAIAPLRLIRRDSLERLMRQGTGGAPSTYGARSMLVAVQAALSVVLIVTAALMGRTVANLRAVDLGFDPDGLLTFSVDPQLHGFASTALDRLARDIDRRLVEHPGVAATGFIAPAPLGSSYFTASLGAENTDGRPVVVGAGYYVTPGMLPTLGLRVLAGDARWRADSGTVVISRTTAEKLFPGEEPGALIGRLVPARRAMLRIVAVIEDVQLSEITGDPPPVILRPLSEGPRGLSMVGFVRTSRRPSSLIPTVRRAVGDAAPDLPVFNVRTARQTIDLQFAERHAMARAATTLGLVGLVLATIGLYGVLSNIVAARRREIGIRAALGATPGRIMTSIARNGLIPVAAGLVVGVAAAVAVSKLLAAHLYDLDRLDPASYIIALGALMFAALAASIIPSYRATRVSAAAVLRED